MSWKSVILVLLAVQLVTSDPLTRQENERRIQTCGKGLTKKVYQGREAEQSEAPWSVYFLRINGQTADVCTGTLISPRHIVMATHCFADLPGTEYVVDGVAKNCVDQDNVITDSDYLKKIRLQSNKKEISRYPEKVTLVNACMKRAAINTKNLSNNSPQYYIDDFAIIDLYDDLKISSTLQTVCVAENRDANNNGIQLDYYGFGLNPPTDSDGEDNSGILRYEEITVSKYDNIEDYFFVARNADAKTVTCTGDSGGGAITKGIPRTIVGALSQTNCANPKKRVNKDFTEMYSSVGYYNEKICKLTGICNSVSQYDQFHKDYVRQPKPPRPTEAPKVVLHNMGPAPKDKNSEKKSGGSKNSGKTILGFELFLASLIFLFSNME